jgi:hypothetical protein
MHPSTQVRWICNDIGHGVVAADFIPKGTLIWVRDALDREFSPGQLAEFDPPHRRVLDTYCFRNRNGHYVLCWDHGRYMNHSFRPNCLPTPYGFELAICDIPSGVELTDDYGTLNILEPFRPADEGTRRKTVQPDDLVRHHRHWDRKLQRAFSRIPHVPQPLLEFLGPDTWASCLRVARGEEPMRSILELAVRPVG